MGSYKQGYSIPTRVISIVTLLIALVTTTHEPPRVGTSGLGCGGGRRGAGWGGGGGG